MKPFAARVSALERRLGTNDAAPERVVLTMHPDGSGTDETSGRTYTRTELAEIEASGAGWLVHVQERNPCTSAAGAWHPNLDRSGDTPGPAAVPPPG